MNAQDVGSKSDEEVAAEAAAGDRGALEILWKRYEKRLERLCRGMIRRESEVHDLVQETFLRLANGLNRYVPGKPVRPWLYSIGRHVIVDHLRRQGRWWDLEPAPASESAPAEDPVLRAESVERVREAIARLAEPYRLVILYTVIEDFTPAEIAEVLGIPGGRVRVHLYRALQLLGKEIGT